MPPGIVYLWGKQWNNWVKGGNTKLQFLLLGIYPMPVGEGVSGARAETELILSTAHTFAQPECTITSLLQGTVSFTLKQLASVIGLEAQFLKCSLCFAGWAHVITVLGKGSHWQNKPEMSNISALKMWVRWVRCSSSSRGTTDPLWLTYCSHRD